MNGRELLLKFRGDVSGLRESTAEVKRTLNGTADDAGKAGTTASKRFGGGLKSGIVGVGKMVAGPMAALFAADKIKDFFVGAMDEAREAQKVGAQTTAVLKSTGGAAKVSAAQIGDYAGAISKKAGIDDEAIQSGENMLLTFTNVQNRVGKGNDIFKQATQTMTDMSVATGQDMKGSALQLGKALNDPYTGITKLSRVGVQFTQQQQAQIKALTRGGDAQAAVAMGLIDSTTTYNNLVKKHKGDTIAAYKDITSGMTKAQKKQFDYYSEGGHDAEAQKRMLHELNKEFGGSAAAQATGADKLKTAWGNFQELVGTKLLPVVDSFEGLLADKLLPAASSLVGWVGGKLVPGIGKLFGAFRGGKKDTDGVSSAFSRIAGGVGVVAHGFEVVGAALGTVLVPMFHAIVGVIKQNMPAIKGMLGDLGSALGSWGQALAGFGKVLLGVWKVIGPTVIALVKNTLGTVIGVLSGVFKVVAGAFEILAGIFTGNGTKIKEGFGKVLGGLGKIVGSIFSGMWNAVKILTAPAVKWITGKITDLKNGITKGLSGAWHWVSGTFGKLWAGAKSLISKPINGARDAISGAWGKIKGGFTSAKNWVSGAWHKGWSGVKGWIGDAVGKGRDAVGGALSSARAKFSAVRSWVGGQWRQRWANVKSFMADPVGQGKARIGNLLSAGKRGIGGVFSGAVSMIGRTWSKLKPALIAPINAAIGVINRGLIKGGINWILGKLHVPNKEQLPWIPPIKLRDGGYSRGRNAWQRGGVDRIPALVDDGEFHVRTAASERAERQLPGGLDYLNRTGRWPVGPAAEVAGANVNAHRGPGVPTNLDGIPGNLAAIAARGPRRGDPAGAGANPLGYAVGQLGQMGWYNRCLAFVNAAWNYSVGRFRLGTARQSANAGPRTMGGVAPAGAAGYWDTGWAGHVALSAGDGSYFSNDVVVPGRIDRVPKSRIDAWGPFMGWWHPNGAAAGTGAPGGKLGAMITGAWDFLKGLDPIKWLRDKAASIAGGITQGGALAGGLRQIPRTILDLGGSGLRNLFAGIFDSGGVLPVGTSLVHNGTGRPEQLFNVDDVLAAAGRTGGDSYVFNIDGALDEAAVARKIEGILLRHGRITGPVQINRRTGAGR